MHPHEDLHRPTNDADDLDVLVAIVQRQRLEPVALVLAYSFLPLTNIAAALRDFVAPVIDGFDSQGPKAGVVRIVYSLTTNRERLEQFISRIESLP
jgi:hypothetical protein